MVANRKTQTVWLLLAFFLVLLGVSGYWGYSFWQKSGALPAIKQAPDFTLKNLRGEEVRFSQLNGKVRLVEFLFTNCPDVCPLTTLNMVKVQRELQKKNRFGSKVAFVSISFDPQRDTPEVLQKYAASMGMDSNGWTVLRGTEEETERVVKAFNILVQKTPDGSFIHSTRSLFLIDASGQIRKIYSMGSEMNNDEVLKDIAELLN